MGIQAGVSTEHLWDGHLPWLCCKQVKMALHTTQYVLQSLGTMGSIPDGASRILLVTVRPDKIIFLSPYKICSSQDQSLPTLFSMKFSVRWMNAVFIQPEPQAAAIWFPSTTEHSGNNSRAGKKKTAFFSPIS